MLKHGHEGVRQIEAQVTNTMGWSATTGQVDPWVYQRLSETFVLDEEMRERLAELNPTASARMANRLLEAHDRDYWQPDAETLAALQDAADAGRPAGRSCGMMMRGHMEWPGPHAHRPGPSPWRPKKRETPEDEPPTKVSPDPAGRTAKVRCRCIRTRR